MTPLPGVLEPDGQVIAWRLDAERHAPTWSSGVGARTTGGRWNTVGASVIYASLDPSTAILEVAVHKGFRVLDTQPHVLTAAKVLEPELVHVVRSVPNPGWLRPGTPSLGQQQFGDDLLGSHPFVAIPSAVSPHSWNLLINPVTAAGKFDLLTQEPFALDTRLHPPPSR